MSISPPQLKSPAFDLTDRRGRAAPGLQSVQVEGQVDGLLFEFTLRQRFCNSGPDTLELVYTFPLPTRAVLMGFASVLNGTRQEAVVMARSKAERGYEQALDAGDAPVMLEALGDGLHSANIGNLMPGDALEIELRVAQWLLPEQGLLRLSLPASIAPRYGQPAQAGLQPQQAPRNGAEARYPLSLSLRIGPPWAGAELHCPTHAICLGALPDGARTLALGAGAQLDRDFVLQLVPPGGLSASLLRAADPFNREAPQLLIGHCSLPEPEPAALQPVALKLLVDCSGSMQGASIDSARRAVLGLLDGLDERDAVSLTCFGSQVVPVTALERGNGGTQHALRVQLRAMQANLGGTEMAAALQAVFAQAQVPGRAADVLLITDGEIWDTSVVLEAARRSGHRLFVIGVGHSPAEGLLRQLALASGGACEFATPGESLEQAAQRMLRRARQAQSGHWVLDSGAATPIWCAPLPEASFGGDTVMLMAGFAAGALPERLQLGREGEATLQLSLQPASTALPGDTAARMAAWARLPGLPEAQAASLAVRYQLLTEQTHALLVHERSAAERFQGLPRLQVVPQMPVVEDLQISFSRRQLDDADPFGDRCVPSVWRTARAPLSSASNGLDDIEIPSFLRRQNDEDTVEPPACLVLSDVQRHLVQHLERQGSAEGLGRVLALEPQHPALQAALQALLALGLSGDAAWLLLARWLAECRGLQADSLAQLLALDRCTPEQWGQGCQALEAALGAYGANDWQLSRVQRLKRSLARLLP